MSSKIDNFKALAKVLVKKPGSITKYDYFNTYLKYLIWPSGEVYDGKVKFNSETELNEAILNANWQQVPAPAYPVTNIQGHQQTFIAYQSDIEGYQSVLPIVNPSVEITQVSIQRWNEDILQAGYFEPVSNLDKLNSLVEKLPKAYLTAVLSRRISDGATALFCLQVGSEIPTFLQAKKLPHFPDENLGSYKMDLSVPDAIKQGIEKFIFQPWVS